MTASYYMRGKSISLAGSSRGAGHGSSEDADRGTMAAGGLLLEPSSSSAGNSSSSSSTPASLGGRPTGSRSTGESDDKMEIDSSSTGSSSRKRKRGTDISDAGTEQIAIPGNTSGRGERTPESYPPIGINFLCRSTFLSWVFD